MGVSKAAKKNQKRRGTSKTGSEAAVKDQEQIVNERPVDPLSQLQSQIAQAKADKVKKMWSEDSWLWYGCMLCN